MSDDVVLVTGGSGFLGAHCIIALAEAGYRVRTTVRSREREPALRALLASAGADLGDRLWVGSADLSEDDGWAEAVTGADYAFHVASPFPLIQPRNADDVVRPAREGALRLLRAARDAGVRRVVLTSSFAAVGYGHAASDQKPFIEDDWTDPDADVSPYVRSKTLAERAAWEFVDREGGALELSVINPVGIFGPVLGPALSSSIEIVKRLMEGSMPGIPRVFSGIVDVRDVADLHVRAMTAPAASGQRFLAIAGNPMSMSEMAQVLRAELGESAARVPTRVLPNWVVRSAAVFQPALRDVARRLDSLTVASNAKARQMLDWHPRSNEEALVATAESLIRLGLLKH